jgi:hypothetical protein
MYYYWFNIFHLISPADTVRKVSHFWGISNIPGSFLSLWEYDPTYRIENFIMFMTNWEKLTTYSIHKNTMKSKFLLLEPLLYCTHKHILQFGMQINNFLWHSAVKFNKMTIILFILFYSLLNFLLEIGKNAYFLTFGSWPNITHQNGLEKKTCMRKH